MRSDAGKKAYRMREKAITFYLSDIEYAMVEDLVSSLEESKAHLLRRLIRSEFRREFGPDPAPKPTKRPTV